MQTEFIIITVLALYIVISVLNKIHEKECKKLTEENHTLEMKLLELDLNQRICQQEYKIIELETQIKIKDIGIKNRDATIKAIINSKHNSIDAIANQLINNSQN